MTKQSISVILDYFIACSGWYGQRSAKFPFFFTSHLSSDATFLRKGDIAQ